MNRAMVAQFAECIIKHVEQAKRDGVGNSLDHVEKVGQDAKAILAEIDELEYEIPLHHL